MTTGDVPEPGGVMQKMQDLLAHGPQHWVLDEHGHAVATRNILEWGAMFDDIGKRRVARLDLGRHVHISTVFLGIDHGWGDGPPVLWETMIFGGKHDEYMDRYASREDAELGHKAAVALVLAKPPGRKCRSHYLKTLWKKYRRSHGQTQERH